MQTDPAAAAAAAAAGRDPPVRRRRGARLCRPVRSVRRRPFGVRRPAFDVVTVALSPGGGRPATAAILPGSPRTCSARPTSVVPGGLARGAIGQSCDARLHPQAGAAGSCRSARRPVARGSGSARGPAARRPTGPPWTILRALDTGAEVHPEARVVDNGAVITRPGSAPASTARSIVPSLSGEAPAARRRATWNMTGPPPRRRRGLLVLAAS